MPAKVITLTDELLEKNIGALLPRHLLKIREILNLHKAYNISLARDDKHSWQYYHINPEQKALLNSSIL